MLPVAGYVDADGLLDLRVGHVLDVLVGLPSSSVHTVVTSPPYYRLRSYKVPDALWPDGWVGQLGLEPSPEQFIEHLVSVFAEVKRVLRPDGSLWLNIDDTYSKGELLGIPWGLVNALRADGWKVRSENVWHVLGGMPESVFSRTTRMHEFVFHLTPGKQWYYDTDAVREPYAPDNRRKTTVKAGPNSLQHRDGERWPHPEGRIKRSVWRMPTANYPGAHFAVFPNELPEVCIRATTSERGCCPNCGAPWKRIVEADGESVAQRRARQDKRYHDMNIAPRSDGGSLQQGVKVESDGERRTIGWEPTCKCVDRSILSIDGHPTPFESVPCLVLDPFVGSGTTMVMARRLGRASIGIEASAEYATTETARRLERWERDPARTRIQVLDGQEALFE